MPAKHQKLHSTGHREPTSPHEAAQHTKALPTEDANANRTFFGPGGLLKGAGSGRFKTGLDLNVRPIQDASRFQRARQRK